jgi:kumamolisin
MADEPRVVGRPDPNETIEITLLLRCPADLPSAEVLGQLRPHERQYLNHEEFAARHGASPEDVAGVRAFASEYGLHVIETNVAQRTLKLSGTPEQLCSAFKVDLVHHEHERGVFRTHEGILRIPRRLSGVVLSVFGLHNKPVAEPHLRYFANDDATLPDPDETAHYTPPQLANLYDFPKSTGEGQCIAILSFGGGFIQEDLDAYFEQVGVPAPSVTAVPVGANNDPVGNPVSFDAEVMMDIEVAGAVAPGARIVVYFAPNDPQGWVNALRRAVHDVENDPSVISVSWGAIEDKWFDDSTDNKRHFIEAVDQAFHEAALKGITVCCSSGDHGSQDGRNQGAHVHFPACSPHVLSCGGTTLTASEGKIDEEVVWNDLEGPMKAATGGGVSKVFSPPAWQAAAKVPPSANDGNMGRGLPDVAAHADPRTGYLVRVDGVTTVLGGTSASTPLWAGLIARLNEALGFRVGYFNPHLYKDLARVEAFRTITQGNNGHYEAQYGWDACTGWGSPDGIMLLDALKPPD